MCGIAGIMCLKRCGCDVGENLNLLKKMTDQLAHRGPDGEGQSVLDEGNVFLGHRRLAIIDLSENAKQPMQSTNQRFCITYNGEIYNYKELRNRLIECGYSFRTQSDTEVLLAAFEEWGVECTKYLNGIFAFAVWDNHKKELFLVRDRYGTKPLYYAQIGNQLLFASEYKAIILHPLFKHEMNFKALKEYFTFQNIFSNGTLLKGIKLLNHGSYLKISYDDEKIPNEVKYWDFDFKEDNLCATKEEYEEELDRLFVQAVNRQLVSDVALGAYLSGGIDSGSITAIASKKIKGLKSFTCGFDLHSASGIELAYDEREKAEYMSYLFQTEHYEMVLKAGDMERCLNELVWHVEDPRVGQSYPNYYAAKLASSFVKVVLAGAGGDELFAGYPWRYYKVKDCGTFEEYVDGYYDYWQRIVKEDEIDNFFAPVRSKISEYSMRDVFKKAVGYKKDYRFTIEDTVNMSLCLEARTFLHGLLLVEDKLSMAHGLETRVPFLDNDLVDFALRVPVKYKLANANSNATLNENDLGQKVDRYYERNRDGKLIMRSVMKKYIPNEIAVGKKQGFSAPDASWFKGESIDYVRSVIDNSNSLIYQYMDKKMVQDMFNKHITGEENKRLLIWSIINMEIWLKLYMNKSV